MNMLVGTVPEYFLAPEKNAFGNRTMHLEFGLWALEARLVQLAFLHGVFQGFF